MAKRQRIDWTFIKPLFCAGGISNCEIVNQYNEAHLHQTEWKSTVAESAIRKQAKKDNWQKNLSDRVKKQVREKLVRETCEVRTTDDEIIDQAAETIAQVVRLHRKDVDCLKQLEADLIKRLAEDETQIIVGWHKGEATEHEIKLGLDDRTKVYRQLVAAISQRISIERLAWGIDEKNSDLEKDDRVEVHQNF